MQPESNHTTFQVLMQDPDICPVCDLNWRFAIGQFVHGEGWVYQIALVGLRHCVNVCKTLSESTFNKLKEGA